MELFNPTTATLDMSGSTLAASDVFQGFVLPAGSTIPAGGHLVVDEARFPLGLRAADVVHFFSRYGVQVDSYLWATNPVATYGRCPDGSGDFVVTTAATRDAPNACAPPTGQ